MPDRSVACRTHRPMPMVSCFLGLRPLRAGVVFLAIATRTAGHWLWQIKACAGDCRKMQGRVALC